MSRLSRSSPLALGLLSAGALGLAALSARSQPAPASGSASASASASGSGSAAPASSASGSAAASASGSAAPAAPKAVLRGADLPTTASDPPKDKKEWEAAKVVSPNSGGSDVCVFKVLREWLRIECPDRIGGALVVGDPADVKVWAWGDPFGGRPGGSGPPQTVIVMPLRRGESRIVDLVRVDEGGWDWVGPGRAERISVAWRASSEDPFLFVSSPPL